MSNENIIIYDWLSFTVKTEDPVWVIDDILGLGHVPWESVKGAQGYRDRMYFNCISVHYNGREDMGVWVELSGQGCRAFEELTDLPEKWETLFKFISSYKMHITRLDVAYDDHVGVLDIKRISKDTNSLEFVSRSTYWESRNSSVGQTVQFGKNGSKVLIRIYDKARERNCPEGEHWIRCELQLRDERAESFTQLFQPIGQAYSGVIMNYLRFVNPDDMDSNKWRWPIKPYWRKFLHSAEKIRLYRSPGTDYNLDRCKRFVFRQAGNAIDAYIKIHGKDDFFEHLKNRPVRQNPKYTRLVSEHGVFNPDIAPKPPTQADYDAEEQRIKATFNPDSDTPIVDRYSRRWLLCPNCNKIMLSEKFSVFGGKWGVNRAVCTDCAPWGEYGTEEFN